MTRLKSEDVSSIPALMGTYNAELSRKTGQGLSEIAASASGASTGDINPRQFKVGVVPLTCGEGVISGFSQAVAGIISYLGFEVFVTDKPDAGGLAQAVSKGAGIIFQADDLRFVAVNLRNGKTTDNSDATGRAFAAALSFMCGGFPGKQVLIVGAGQVGCSAATAMGGQGAKLFVYDIDQKASRKLAKNVEKTTGKLVTVESNLEDALLQHHIIFDACPVHGFIKEQYLSSETLIAAPGVPLGVDPNCRLLVEERTIHDSLQLGVATMLYDVSRGA